MKFESQLVHNGDRKRQGENAVASTTPISLGTTYFYESAAKLDRVLGNEEHGFSYARYANPTNEALEDLVTKLENGSGSLATSSGMSAIQIALQAALLDRSHSIVASDAIYGASLEMLDKLFASFNVRVKYVDIYDLQAVWKAVADLQHGSIFMESI